MNNLTDLEQYIMNIVQLNENEFPDSEVANLEQEDEQTIPQMYLDFARQRELNLE